MRNPRSFGKPLAIGAPTPWIDIPVRPSRMIHFFDPSNPRMAEKVPDIARKVDILLGNLVLVLIPVTKIAHCVLYPFSQLVFQLGWHFPADTGRHVSTVLNKEDQPV